MTWSQNYDPLHGPLSTVAAALPIVVLLSLLAVRRIPAYVAALTGLQAGTPVAGGGVRDEGAISVEGSNTAIKDWPQLFPRLSANADLTISGKAGLIDGSDPNGIYGAQGELRRIAADIGDGKVMTLTGPFSFDARGLLSGKFRLEIEQLGPWGDSLKQSFPEIASTVDTATKLLKALAGGGDKVSVDLVVDHGNATVGGFIPLGKIPPI